MVHMRAISAAVEKLVVSPLPHLGTRQLWVAWPVLATLWIFLDVFVAAFTESAAPKLPICFVSLTKSLIDGAIMPQSSTWAVGCQR